jgi:outer membrane protein TolC
MSRQKLLYTFFFSITILAFTGTSDAAKASSGDKKIISCQQAIRIALGESFRVNYYQEEIAATRFSYLYTRSEFKPLLNLSLFTPSWSEELAQISQVDGLPVYNSVGSIQAGSNLVFTYVLPSGGNFAFLSRTYWENYRTTLSRQENRELERDQVYSRLALSFNQPIFTANLLKENMKIAELDYKKSTCYFTRVQMDIIYDVTSGFYQVYQLARAHQINQERLDNSREALRVARLKHETGHLAEGELLIAEITVAQDEVRVMESLGKLDAAKDAFKLLIGMELHEEIEPVADMEFDAFVIDLQTAIREAQQNRMEIQESNLDIQLQEIEIKRARRKRELRGDISAFYDFTGLSTLDRSGWGAVGQLIASSFDNMQERPANRGIALTLSYPIADWGRAKNQIRREQVRLKQQKLNLENTRRTIEREIREIVRTVYEAEKRFRINQRNREVTLRSYRISRLRFENGDMNSQELAIEQERLSQVQLACIESYVTYRLAVADLNRKTMYDFENHRSYLPERQNER